MDLGTGKNKAGGSEVREVFMRRIMTSGPVILNKNKLDRIKINAKDFVFDQLKYSNPC